MARKNAIVSVSLEGSILEFNVEGIGGFEVDTAELNADVARAALIHGIVQKISDAAALGKEATPGDKFAAMQAVRDRLCGPDGTWNKRAGEGAGAPVGIIFTALLEYTQSRAKKAKRDIPTEQAVREYYDGKTRAEQLAFRKVPEIAAIIERIKSEKGAVGNVDTDSLLSDLDNL